MEKKYVSTHKENNTVFLNITINQEAFSHKLIEEYLGLPRMRDNYVLFKGGTEEWFCNPDILRVLGEKIAKKIHSEKNYGKKILIKTEEIAVDLYKKYYEIFDLLENENPNFKKIADKWEEAIETFFKICSVGFGAVMADLSHYGLSNALEKIVNKKIEQYKLKRSLGSYVGVLGKTSLKTKSFIFKKKLFDICQEIERLKIKNIFLESPTPRLFSLLKRNYPALFSGLNDLVYQFRWIDYGHIGPEMDLKKLIEKIEVILEDKKELGNLKESVDLRPLIKLQEQYFKELNLDEGERHYFETAREFAGAKMIRSELLFFTFYLLTLSLKRFARSSGKDYKDLQNLTRFEFIRMLRGGKIPRVSMLRQRYNFCVNYVKDLNDLRIFTGEKAEKIIREKFQIERVVKTGVIKGNIACAGKVRGVVKIINEPYEMKKIKKDDILVAVQTIPQLLPAMKLAAAFVTDIGGITSHAAIVAREMNKPCIIGTKNASKILKDGDLVEVDATKGVVKVIK
ncbi:hypothetical protein HZB93_00305 [Candidatus Falkowbacteria bacterium]|nr:hypothetical protein [Candidatus Falkowbacteria bacterium]